MAGSDDSRPHISLDQVYIRVFGSELREDRMLGGGGGYNEDEYYCTTFDENFLVISSGVELKSRQIRFGGSAHNMFRTKKGTAERAQRVLNQKR